MPVNNNGERLPSSRSDCPRWGNAEKLKGGGEPFYHRKQKKGTFQKFCRKQKGIVQNS
jgi:hypothetical protein